MKEAAERFGVSCPAGHQNCAQLKKPRQRGQLHAVVRRAGRTPGRTRPGTRRPPPSGAPRGGWGARRHAPCVGHGPTGRTDGRHGSPAPGTRPHRAPAPAAARATPPWGARQGPPQTRRATESCACRIPTGQTDGPTRTIPPRSCRHGSPPTTAPRAAPATRHPPALHPDPGPRVVGAQPPSIAAAGPG